MSAASERRRATARHEAGLTGQPWISDRQLKRQRPVRPVVHQLVTMDDGQRRLMVVPWHPPLLLPTVSNAAALLNSAAAFAVRDDAARGLKRYARIDPARGDGEKPTHKERQPAVTVYNESARTLLGY